MHFNGIPTQLTAAPDRNGSFVALVTRLVTCDQEQEGAVLADRP